MKSALALALVLVGAVGAEANTIYTYEGGTFGNLGGVYTLGDRITGSLELADSFVGIIGGGPQDVTSGVIRYSFTDGHQTLTEANSTGHFELPWRISGPVLPGPDMPRFQWTVFIGSETGRIDSFQWDDRRDQAFLGPGPFEQAVDFGYNCTLDICFADFQGNGGPGTWTAQTVPEPAMTTLLLPGMGGLGVVGWQERRRRGPNPSPRMRRSSPC